MGQDFLDIQYGRLVGNRISINTYLVSSPLKSKTKNVPLETKSATKLKYLVLNKPWA